MRILLVSAEYPPDVGGVGDYTRCLAEALAVHGHLVGVATGVQPSSGNARQDAQRLGMEHPALHDVASNGRVGVIALETTWGWEAWRKLAEVVALFRPDVVHIQYQTGAYRQHPAINLFGWWRKQRSRNMMSARPALVVTAHDLRLPYLFPKADLVRRWLTSRMLRDAAAVITTNAEDAARLTGGKPGDREHFAGSGFAPQVIPIGSNIPVAPPAGYARAAWRAQSGVGDAPLVGYFGLLNPSKGVRALVETLPLLPDARLLLIGGAATNAQEIAYAAVVEQTAEALGVAGRILRTGAVDTAVVSAHLLACDVVALPFADGASYRRGSLLAALAHGSAVVTTTPALPLDPPLHDAVQLVAHDAPALLGPVLAALLSDDLARQRLGAAAQRLAARFAWPAIAAQHEAVYNSVLQHDDAVRRSDGPP